jgi:HAD superfamily hydrolase (TIGR01450 family)
MPSPARFAELVDRYDAFLFDAYGVLVDSGGVCTGAASAIAHVRAAGKPLRVVTNDASRLPASAAARFAGVGLPITADEIVSSGQLLVGHVAAAGLAGARALVLGTDDARAYARLAGLETFTAAELAGATDIDAIVVSDDAGFALLEGINAALTAAVHALDRGRPLALICPNPDIIYPRGGGALGFTAGGLALMLEAGMRRRHPGAPGFAYLGKPAPAIFALAQATLPDGARPLMIGDQLETDIAGACGAGLECALVTGVSRWRDGDDAITHIPQWLLDDLA